MNKKQLDLLMILGKISKTQFTMLFSIASIVFILIIGSIIFTVNLHNNKNNIKILTSTIDTMRIQLDAQTNHYNHCLWLNKDSIGITRNGVLYDKYYKKNKYTK